NYCLRLALGIQPGCPSKRKPGRKHEFAVELCLILIAKSEAQGKVRPHLPIVLEEGSDVPLLYFGERIAARDDQLIRGGGVLQGAAIAIEARKDKRAAEIIWRRVGD